VAQERKTREAKVITRRGLGVVINIKVGEGGSEKLKKGQDSPGSDRYAWGKAGRTVTQG